VKPFAIGRRRSSWLAQFLQLRLYLRDHGQVLLAFVALERLLERLGGLVGAAGGGQHVGQVAERVAVAVEIVRPVAIASASRARSASACSPRWAWTRALHLPPQHLRDNAVAKLFQILGEFERALSEVIDRRRDVLAPSVREVIGGRHLRAFDRLTAASPMGEPNGQIRMNRGRSLGAPS
jgi:hypothetical protein